MLNWVGIIATALIGGLTGFASARFQDKLRRRDGFRAIARALQADADRMRRELGPPEDRYVELNAYGTSRAAPTLHRWTERLIADSGEIDSALVAEFLALDTQLNNFGVYLDKLRETSATVASLRAQQRAGETAGVSGALQTVSSRRQADELQPAATFAHDRIVDARREAVRRLDAIDVLLAPYSQPS